MTEQELNSLHDWVLAHYFDDLEEAVDAAAVRLRRGDPLREAVDDLRRACTDALPGQVAEDAPRFDTVAGAVRVWEGRHGEPVFGRGPDAVIPLEQLCREKLVATMQARLF